MRIARNFTVTLNVANPNEFATDMRGNALLRVRELYEGKCHKACLIVKVLSITNLSAIYANQTGRLYEGTIDVQFSAACSRFNAGDIYPGVRISHSSHVVMGRGVALGTLGGPGGLVANVEDPSDVLSDGFVIPVTISDIEYPPGGASPVASVSLLTCRKSETPWVVSGGAVPDDLIDEMWHRVGSALDSLRAAEERPEGSSVIKLFRLLLHTYSGGANAPGGNAATPLTTRAELNAWAQSLLPDTAWARPTTDNFDSAGVGLVAVSDSATRAGAAAVFTAVTAEIASAAQFMADAADIYASQKLVKNQMGVWRAMKAEQLPPRA
jgi:hypothetical protein